MSSVCIHNAESSKDKKIAETMAPLVATLCSCPPLTVLPLCCFLSGSGIGTGPGVIQDRYSPTMGRHRTNPLFNGHGAHIAPPPQSQFDIGPKSFVKSNQVSSAHIPASLSWFPTVTPDSRVLFVFFAIPTGSEPAFPQPEPEPLGPAASPVQGPASSIQQERTAQCGRGDAALLLCV